jgi:choline dehydrogenase-like flavoprotein
VSYDLIVAGTGFASSFFLLEYLARAKQTARVLVLERGWRETRAWQLREGVVSRLDSSSAFTRDGLPSKDWFFTLGFGGGSNCWWGCTPRFMPNDFRLRTAYGVGDDWPIGYEDLEPAYERVEAAMGISGPSGAMPYPRRVPHPQPPHRLSDPDRVLAQAYPGLYVAQPTARARIATGQRGVCCANGVCGLCPVDAKFTIENGLASVYRDPRVTLRTGCEVKSVDVQNGRARAVRIRDAEGTEAIAGDFIVLGTGALFNAAILLRSSLPHPRLGRRLFEQVSVTAHIDLAGIDNFQGSTAVTANGYMLYDGPHRATEAGCLIESWNRAEELRWESGRERQLLSLKLIFEDVPQDRNQVVIGEGDRPVMRFEAYSDYARRAMAGIRPRLERVLAPLPVERLAIDSAPSPSEGHMLGTVVMGNDPASSVVDRTMVHHQVRNLAVIGGSAFPAGGPANPTLTIAAHALWSAERIFS